MAKGEGAIGILMFEESANENRTCLHQVPRMVAFCHMEGAPVPYFVTEEGASRSPPSTESSLSWVDCTFV